MEDGSTRIIRPSLETRSFPRAAQSRLRMARRADGAANREDAYRNVYPFDESPGAGIIMDVDLEQLIRESERLRVCKAIFNSSSIENWHLRDALEAVLAEPSVAPASNDVPEPCIPAQEADHD